jgi:hypothetical protein
VFDGWWYADILQARYLSRSTLAHFLSSLRRLCIETDLTEDCRSTMHILSFVLVAFVLPFGITAEHLRYRDFMIASDLDPPIEKQYIQRWIDEWRNQQRQQNL